MSEDMDPPVKGKKTKKVKAEDQTTKSESDEAPPEKKKRASKPAKFPYEYRRGGIIRMREGATEPTYKGQRRDWFDSAVGYIGKSVDEWVESRKGVVNKAGTVQAPLGWMRRFILDGYLVLEGGEPRGKKEEEKEAA